MRLTRIRIAAGFTVLCSFILSFAINLVMESLPSWVHLHAGMAWLLILPSLGFLLMTAIKASPESKIMDQAAEDQLNRFIQVVNEADTLSANNPGLRSIPHKASKLAEWEALTVHFIQKISTDKLPSFDIHKSRLPHLRPDEKISYIAGRVLCLTRVLIGAYAQPKEKVDRLNDIIVPAYCIAVAYKMWDEAAFIAYEIAIAYNEINAYIEANMWKNQMEMCVNKEASSRFSDALKARFFELKGIMLRDFDGEKNEARRQLNSALLCATKANDFFLMWRATTHLGKLESQTGNLQLSAELYSDALNIAKLYEANLKNSMRPTDPELRLACYQALGEIAYQQDDTKKAYMYYLLQLKLSRNFWHKMYRINAYRGLAKSLEKRGVQRARRTYRLARTALQLEEEISGQQDIELLNLLVRVADIFLLQKVK